MNHPECNDEAERDYIHSYLVNAFGDILGRFVGDTQSEAAVDQTRAAVKQQVQGFLDATIKAGMIDAAIDCMVDDDPERIKAGYMDLYVFNRDTGKLMGDYPEAFLTGRFVWPALPGQPQHEWEASRLASGTKYLNPEWVGQLMGFPPGWTDCISRRAALKALGNAVVPPVIAVIGAVILFINWLLEGEERG